MSDCHPLPQGSCGCEETEDKGDVHLYYQSDGFEERSLPVLGHHADRHNVQGLNIVDMDKKIVNTKQSREQSVE